MSLGPAWPIVKNGPVVPCWNAGPFRIEPIKSQPLRWMPQSWLSSTLPISDVFLVMESCSFSFGSAMFQQRRNPKTQKQPHIIFACMLKWLWLMPNWSITHRPSRNSVLVQFKTIAWSMKIRPKRLDISAAVYYCSNPCCAVFKAT